MKQIILVLALAVAYLFPVNPQAVQSPLRVALHEEAMDMLTGDQANPPPQLRMVILRDADGVLRLFGLEPTDTWSGDGV